MKMVLIKPVKIPKPYNALSIIADKQMPAQDGLLKLGVSMDEWFSDLYFVPENQAKNKISTWAARIRKIIVNGYTVA